ncbi:MAG: hypothetical protein AVDCRST_MAG49-112, partial [uncultured Thermomicrobiales bacterium]
CSALNPAASRSATDGQRIPSTSPRSPCSGDSSPAACRGCSSPSSPTPSSRRASHWPASSSSPIA